MAHRTPGPGKFALHTPKAQPNKGATAICRILRITRTSSGESEFYLRGCRLARFRARANAAERAQHPEVRYNRRIWIPQK